MTETLTYDPTPADAPELSKEEQNSLEVAEKLGEEEAGLLAGKYKDAQELEKAYVELQKKFGEQSSEDSSETGERPDTESKEETEEEKEVEEISPAAELITSANDEFNEKGELTDETIEKFSSLSSKELVEAYLQLQDDMPTIDRSEVADISESDINQIKNSVGGDKSYDNMVTWASENLDQTSVDAFDEIINTGSIDAIKLAVSGLRSQYENANGYEGEMLSGKAPKGSRDVFRSQA